MTLAWPRGHDLPLPFVQILEEICKGRGVLGTPTRRGDQVGAVLSDVFTGQTREVYWTPDGHLDDTDWD